MAKTRILGQISKIEEQADGTIRVFGVASTPTPDSDGEIITADCMKAAIPDYMQKRRALREMHQPIAAGVTESLEVDDDGVTHIVAHVVDPTSVLKVQTGVLKMFSVEGVVPKGGRDTSNKKQINKLKLREISLVDVGANPDADLEGYEIVKLDGAEESEMEPEVTTEVETPVTPPAESPVVPPATESISETPVAKVAISQAFTDEVKKWAGEEVWDAQRAIEALGSVFSLMLKEMAEPENEAGQVADLQAAVERLKAFIAAEIMEVSTEPTAKVETPVEGEDGVEKKGAKYSASTKAAIAKLRTAHEQVAECLKAFDDADADDAEKVDAGGEDVVAKLATAEDTISKVTAERDTLAKENTELKEQVEKAQESIQSVVDQLQKTGRLQAIDKNDEGGVQKSAASGEAETTDPLDAIKKVHARGGIVLTRR